MLSNYNLYLKIVKRITTIKGDIGRFTGRMSQKTQRKIEQGELIVKINKL